MASDTELQLLQLCTDGNLSTVKDLITKQALNPIEVKDPSGLTLLHLACQHGHLDIVQYLIKDQKCNPETTTPEGCTPLHTACKSGHLQIAKCLITDHKCNPHCTDNDHGYTPLHAASESGNIETVKYLITEQGCDPQVGDSIGNTPLHFASESGHVVIVQCLITDFNCDPQKSNSRGNIPLLLACRGGQTAVARYLINEHQCNPNCTNMFGVTSLHLACLSGCLHLVKYLIDELDCNPQNVSSDKCGNTPLHCACQNGHLEVTKYLITEHKCHPEHGNDTGYTPLHSAASNGHLAIVKYLINELGCNLQITDNNGLTALHNACLNGHLDVTKYLISDCNCNPQCSTQNGFTPLHCACQNGHLEVARYLITEQKCSPEHGNVNGCTPLHSAANNGDLAVVKYLISELGCNPQMADNDGLTPLHYACLSGHLDITKYLISDCKCNPQCSANRGNTPLHCACQNGHLEVAKYLITEHKCNPEHGDVNGSTPLHSATSNGHLIVVKYLITQHNCNPQCSDNDGCTPLHVACSGRHLHIVKYLIHVQKCPCEPEARINPQTEGVTPLQIASILGYLEIVKYLIDECKCNPNHSTSDGLTAIDFAQLRGHQEVVSYLRNEHQCNKNLGQVFTKFMPNFCGVNCDSWIEDFNDMCLSPLDMACINGNLEAVKLFSTGYNYNPSSTSSLGITPLHIACMMGHLGIAKYLITEHKFSKLNCDPQFADNNGLTPLHFACLNGHLDITKYLISDCNCNPQYSAKNGDIPLHCACHNGYLEVVKYLITEHKCSPEHGNLNGITPLHLAASNGHLDVVKYLISELGSNPQFADNNGLTPLHFACLNGHLDINKYLISDCNCNPECSDKKGNSPLQHVCQNGHLEVAKYLITEHKCSPEHDNVNGYKPLHVAASNGHLAVVKYLILDCNCNPESLIKIECVCHNGNTPVHCACENGHLEVAKYLITEHKCSPEHGNVNGYTPLHFAASNGHLAVVKYLIRELGCNLQITTSDDLTPLHFACLNGHLDITKYLISDGNSNPQCSDNNGDTPLHCACKNGHLEVAKYLITEHKSSPKHGNVNGSTPLNSAASNGHLDVVKYLIAQHNCNPQCSDNNGITPLHEACASGHLHVAKYLIQEKNCACEPVARINDTIKYFLPCIFEHFETKLRVFNGITPLHVASDGGHLDTVKYLIDVCKCNPNHSTSNGLTAIDFAQRQGHQEVVVYLRNEHQCSLGLGQVVSNVKSHCLRTFWGLSSDYSDSTSIDVNDLCISHLQRACLTGNLAAVKHCATKSDFNPSATFLGGFTLLHAACMMGHLEIAKYLVTECECDPGTPTYFINVLTTPLYLATLFGQLKVIRWLIIEKNCEPIYFDSECECYIPLVILACQCGHLSVMKYLLSEWNSEDFEISDLLVFACLCGHLNVVKYLIEEFKCNPYVTDNDGITPLHLACAGIQYFKEREYQVSAKSTPSILSIQSILHILLSIVSLPTSLFSNVLPKFLPGFLNCAHKLSDYDITSGARSANHNYNTRSDEEQATPYNFRCLDIVKYLITEHNCKPHCTDKEGETPLHYACTSGQLEIVQYFHSEKFSDPIHRAHSGDTPLHFACKSNQVEVVKFLLSTGECDPLIKNVEGLTPVELATSMEICEQLDHFCKGNYPLESVVKVFVLGDPSAGKSSLVQAIQSNPGFLGSLLGRFQKVKVRQQTAGINSFTFRSSDFGNVVIYDFAGQREFYTSHAAFLQNSSSYVPGIFILVTDIALCEDDIHQTLQYWVLFIEECCAHVQSKTKPYIIFVGSHADQLKGDVEQAFMLIHKCFAEDSENKFYEMSGVISLDCTRPSSPGLDLLRHHLEESCNSIRKRREKIDQRCYVLHKYVHKEYINMGIHGSKLKNISKDLEDNPYLLPSTSSELLPLLQTLHDRGQVIFLRNEHILGNSWVITNIAAMLETVVGSIFSPRNFPQHIAPGSTGIVPKSRMSEAFPDLDIEMVIGFLEHFEFCHQLGVDWVRVTESKQEMSDEEYYLFPALVTMESLPHVLYDIHESRYCCGWFLHSTAEHQFFTARFLHILLLRLAFLFAVPQDNAIPTANKNETPVLKRSCTIWKSGISWHNTNGVSTLLQVSDLKTVILIMSSPKGSEIHCIRLRAQLIKTILKARKEFCPRVDVEECIMEVESEKVIQAIQKCPSQCTKYSLKYVCDRVSTRDAKDHQDLVLVNPDGSPGKQISELLYFEPCTLLTSDLISQMFSRHNSNFILSDAFLSELAARFYLYNNILSQILMPQPRLLSEKLKKDIYSLDSLDVMSQQLRCVHILEAWMEQQKSPPTYRKLRQELNKYSIFCGRNPLDLVCGYWIPACRSLGCTRGAISNS